ncbi:MAG: uracil-xanthine permease family protein [Nitrospinota bacterium]
MALTHEEAPRQILYGIEDKPPGGRAVVFGMQHVLTMFGATASVPLILQGALGMDAAQTGILVTAVMLCSGIATILQVSIGSRLPIIQGVSFSFLAAFFSISGQFKGAEAMQYIAGGIILGAVVEMIVGWGRLIGMLRRILTPVVIGPVIMLIGLALLNVGAPQAAKHWPMAILTIVLIFLFSQIWSRKSLILRMFPILMAIVVVWLLALILSVTGAIGPNHPVYIKLGTVAAAPWFKWSSDSIFLPWGVPKFHVGFFFAILAGYLASMIESFGDYHAVAAMSRAPAPTTQQLNRGIGAEGLGCFITGWLGGFASTSYSENIGLIGITRVASRRVVFIGGIILIVVGLIAKFGILIATIPAPIVGGLYCALFGLISAVGIQQVAKADLRSDRNLMIIGFILFMGLSVPAWIRGWGPPGLPNGAKQIASAFFWAPRLGDIIKAIGDSGMAVAAIIGLCLDNWIPGTQEERGVLEAQKEPYAPIT